MNYAAVFYGRAKGAIGISYPIHTTVEGKNRKQAELNLYDRFEHVHGLTLTALPAVSMRMSTMHQRSLAILLGAPKF
jgi:hypothetical protein